MSIPEVSNRRFSGIVRLYGEQGFAQIQNSHVCIIGVGGVGSWVVESLARSGMGRLTLIDLDNVAESNINRQLAALESTVGRAKIDVLAERVAEINPECVVKKIEDFVTLDNIPEMMAEGYGFVVDCIDDFRVKAKLVAHCRRNKVPLITIGGAGGQLDPAKIRLTDLSKTIHDPLMSKVRYLLRTDYGFSRNQKRKFDVPCVFSEEQLTYPDTDGGVCREKPEASTTGLNCASGFGSATHITATFAFFATGHILKKISSTKSAQKSDN